MSTYIVCKVFRIINQPPSSAVGPPVRLEALDPVVVLLGFQHRPQILGLVAYRPSSALVFASHFEL